jgi:hypothetical protein
MPNSARGDRPARLLDRRLSRKGAQADDFEEATPSPHMTAFVIGLAAALPCLPAAVGILALLGRSAPPSFGLELAGTFLICFKMLSVAYGIGCHVLAAPDLVRAHRAAPTE